MKCPFCNCNLRKKDKYCSECGKLVTHTEAEGKKNRKGYVVLSVLLTISVLISLSLISVRIVETSKKEEASLQADQTTTEPTTTEPTTIETTTQPPKPTHNTQKATTPSVKIRNEYDAVDEVRNNLLAKLLVSGGLGLEINEGVTIEWGEGYVEYPPNADAGWLVTLNGVATGYPKKYSNDTVTKKFVLHVLVRPTGMSISEYDVEDQGVV